MFDNVIVTGAAYPSTVLCMHKSPTQIPVLWRQPRSDMYCNLSVMEYINKIQLECNLHCKGLAS